MTDRLHATWLGATRLVPLRAIGGVGAVACVGVALVAGTPERLRAWIVLTGVVVASVAASAVDDPTESVAASTPVARWPRWTARVIHVALATTAAIAMVAGLGAWAIHEPAESVKDVLDTIDARTVALQIAAYLVLGWALGAVAVRHRGPGFAVRSAGPAIVGFHVAVEATGDSWPHWLLGSEAGTTGWWCTVLGLAAVVFSFAATDPARRLRWRHP